MDKILGLFGLIVFNTVPTLQEVGLRMMRIIGKVRKIFYEPVSN